MSRKEITIDELREGLTKVVAEALYGEGSYPFNRATGFTVKADTETVVMAVIDFIFGEMVAR